MVTLEDSIPCVMEDFRSLLEVTKTRKQKQESSGKTRNRVGRCKDVVIENDKEKQDSEVMSSPQLKTASRNGNFSNAQVTPRQTKPSIGRCKLRKPFKSPLQQQSPGKEKKFNIDEKEEIWKLQCRLDGLSDEITELSKEYEEGELQRHIEKLHEYNEIKDVCQLILGKLAELEGRTIKSLHQEYGLESDD